jgi:hypothetical protein
MGRHPTSRSDLVFAGLHQRVEDGELNRRDVKPGGLSMNTATTSC